MLYVFAMGNMYSPHCVHWKSQWPYETSHTEEFPCNVKNSPTCARKGIWPFFVPFSSSSDLSATQWIYSWLKTSMGFQYLPKLFSRMCVLCNHRQPSLFLLLSSKHCITHGQKAWKFRWFVWEERKSPVYTADQILPCIFMHAVGYISGGVWARVPAGGVSATNRVPKAGAPGCAQGAAPGSITQNPGNGPSFLLSGATQPTNVLFW